MATGILPESWARVLCEITGKLPADKVDEAGALLVWTKLHGATLADPPNLQISRARRPDSRRCSWR